MVTFDIQLICNKCKERGHSGKNCPNKKIERCNKCKERGHSGKKCPKDKDKDKYKDKDKVCYRYIEQPTSYMRGKVGLCYQSLSHCNQLPSIEYHLKQLVTLHRHYWKSGGCAMLADKDTAKEDELVTH